MMELKFDERYDVRYGANKAEAKKGKESIQFQVWDLMRSITEYPEDIQVTCYSYQKIPVCIGDVVFVVERDSLFGLECLFAMKAGVKLDNHVVYAVVRGGNTQYYWFENDIVVCGNKIL